MARIDHMGLRGELVETWRTIPSLPDFEASSLGRIRRARPGRHGKCSPAGHVHAQSVGSGGYLQVKLDGKTRRLSRLAAEAWHGSAPSTSHEISHLNGTRRDNRPESLAWCTHRKNEAHKIEQGTRLLGEAHALAKLTEGDVVEIRRRWEAGGVTQRELGREYGVAQAPIGQILHRRTWRHLP